MDGKLGCSVFDYHCHDYAFVCRSPDEARNYFSGSGANSGCSGVKSRQVRGVKSQQSDPRYEMMPHKVRHLAVAVGAAAMIATPALARTIHAHAAPAYQAHGSNSKVLGVEPEHKLRSQGQEILVCDMATGFSDCEKLRMMLPK